MLGMKTYTKEFVDECRKRVDADLAAYRAIPGPVPEAFEWSFFNNMVLVLDYSFVNRLRVVEGKDGNALNEVRVLCNSILNNNGIMTADNVGGTTAYAGLGALKLSPEKSILRIKAGEPVRLKHDDFARLSEAFFAEMAQRFV